jgi:hypothetical protein
MITTRDEILNNAVTLTTANLNHARMENGEAKKYADVLKQNTNIEKLILSRCAMNDEEFDMIFKALIERGQELTMLVLDYNFLTPASFNNLKELIQKQLVIHLCLYSNDKLLEDKNCLTEFAKLADDNHMRIYTSNPLVRQEKYPGIFSINQPQNPANTTSLNSLESTVSSSEKLHDELKEASSYTSPKPRSVF